MQLDLIDHGFILRGAAGALLAHRPGAPCLFAGTGTPDIACYRGNFRIADYVAERVALRHCALRTQDGVTIADFAAHEAAPPSLSLAFHLGPDHAELRVTAHDAALNRFWLRLPAEPDEMVWGCGEQMSYFDLRGRRFPLWTREPGVGRDKTSADHLPGGCAAARPAATTTPPTIRSPPSSPRAAMPATWKRPPTARSISATAPSTNWRVWAVPQRHRILHRRRLCRAGANALSARFGRQPALPDWVQTAPSSA